MKIKIEDYRNFEIFFDNDKETFYTVSDSWDRDETKKSFASIKKWIDDFIKDNYEFKPFFIQHSEQPEKIYKVIGIRKDKRFIIESKSGVKSQLSEYNENDYILLNDENKKVFDALATLEEEINMLYAKRKTIKANIIKATVRDIKKDRIIE